MPEYRIVRILGQGAFGTVYLAHDTLLDRVVTDSKEQSGRLPFCCRPRYIVVDAPVSWRLAGTSVGCWTGRSGWS